MVCSVSDMMNEVAEQNHTGVCFPFCCRGMERKLEGREGGVHGGRCGGDVGAPSLVLA